jgi:mannose-6-phosphate isomerase-like protein (cupin superfamily)
MTCGLPLSRSVGVLFFSVRQPAAAGETAGKLHAQEARYPPLSAAPPVHRHPRQEERFAIIEGSLLFRVAGEEQIVPAGGEITVPRGAFHCAYNPNATPTLAIWETRPALRTAAFFQDMARASRGRSRPRFADAATILSEYRDEFQMAKPPLFVQRIVFGCLAPFGRRALHAATTAPG